MSKEIIRFDNIQNYLDGKMSAAERQAFEAQLATDASLADEVGVHRLEREMMDILLEDDISSKMQEWQQEKTQLPQRTNGQWKWIAMIAGLIGIALLVFYLWRSNAPDIQNAPSIPTDSRKQQENLQKEEKVKQSKPTKKYNGPVADSEEKNAKEESRSQNRNKELIAMAEDFGGLPEFAGTFVRSAAEAESRFDSANVFIRDKRYNEAIHLLQTIPNDNPEIFLSARLNLGYLYFLKKNFRAAIPPLSDVANSPDYLYAEAAEWYLTLSYLGSNQQAPLKEHLNKILADADHLYHKKAVALKARL